MAIAVAATRSAKTTAYFALSDVAQRGRRLVRGWVSGIGATASDAPANPSTLRRGGHTRQSSHRVVLDDEDELAFHHAAPVGSVKEKVLP